jgi:hypothetical protein
MSSAVTYAGIMDERSEFEVQSSDHREQLIGIYRFEKITFAQTVGTPVLQARCVFRTASFALLRDL